MVKVECEVDRVLLLLRNKIRERGFTQLEVQNCLHWGRSYISQLLTKQKALRLEQVLLILGVIDVDPSAFFEELFPNRGGRLAGRYPDEVALLGRDGLPAPLPELSRSVKELRSMVRGLVGLLVDHEVIGVDDLTVAVQAADQAAA